MAIDALKEETIIIFISGLNLHKSPVPVQEAMASDKARGPTPIMAVFDPMIKTTLGIVPYFDMKDANGFNEVKKAIADWRGEEVSKPKMTLHSPESWKDVRGRSIQAAYVRSSDENVTLRLSNGRLATVELSQLSPESQKRIEELAKE